MMGSKSMSDRVGAHGRTGEAVGVKVPRTITSRKGHKYMTVVYQIDSHRRRLPWTGWDRTEATLRSFFTWFGEARLLLQR